MKNLSTLCKVFDFAKMVCTSTSKQQGVLFLEFFFFNVNVLHWTLHKSLHLILISSRV